MNRCTILATTVLLAACAGPASPVSTDDGTPARPTGPYLGQEPPGTEPRLFAPGLISTGLNEMNLCFAPDGREIYLHLTGARFRPRFILVSRWGDSGWTELREASFSDPDRGDAYPFVAPDGKRVFFNSPRDAQGHHHTIWFAERQGDGWGEPRQLEFQGGFDGTGTYPTVAANGNLYFNGGHSVGGSDIFVSRYEGGVYTEPENLGPAVNSPEGDFHPFIAPDESYILFDSIREEDNLGGNDVYVSFRRDDGTWSPARNVGESVNTEHSDLRPVVSPDGKYLFFTSMRMAERALPDRALTYSEVDELLSSPANGLQDIYWVSAEVLELGGLGVRK